MEKSSVLIIFACIFAGIALGASLLNVLNLTGHFTFTPGDTIILRPNGDTYHLDLREYGFGSAHYSKVYENVSDGDSTYVYEDEVYGEYDLYEFENAIGTGNITSVTVFMECKKESSYASDASVSAVIRTHSSTYNSSYEDVTTSYIDYNGTFPINPYTGNAWTWSEIDDIQAGPRIYRPGSSDLRCTQVWIEVETCAESGNCTCDLTEVWNKLDELEGRINDTEQQIDDLNGSLTDFMDWTDEEIENLWNEIDDMQEEIDLINDSLNSFMNWTWDNFNYVNDRLDDLQDQVDDLQNDMWNMLVYGFHDIITTTRIETFYNPTAEDPISFVAAVPRVTFWWIPIPSIYRIAITGTGPSGSFYQVFDNTVFIQPNTLTDFVYRIHFNQTGTYDLRLILQRPSWWWPNPSQILWESQDFEIDVVALESFIENSTVTITEPAINSNNLSSEQNVSWQKAGLVWMNAILGENTPGEDNYCDVYYDSNLYSSGLEYTEYLARLPVNVGNASKYCQGNILTTKMDNGNEGIYKVCAEAEFIGSFDAEDCISLGIDNSAPIIYGAWPGEIDKVNGIKYFYANIGDDESSGNWSGVEEARLELINKTGGMWYNASLSYNGTVWGVEIDTVAAPIPDNYYTMNIIATDAAGNTATYSIDPIIDNTPPSINSITLTSTMPSSDPNNLFYRGYPITITADITDNLAGVDDSTVYATVDSVNITLTRSDTSTYTGTYATGFDEPLGGRTVTVYADDLATNSANYSTEFNFTYSYTVVLDLNTTTAKKGDRVEAYGTVTYDNGTLVDGEMMIIYSWNGNETINVTNGAFSTTFKAEKTGIITASIGADNGETYTDTEQLTIPSGGGGGGGGCTTDWKLTYCTDCRPAGTKECTYEDKGTCNRGIKITTETCTYQKPAAKVPGQVYVPAGAEIIPSEQPAKKPNLIPYLIGGIAGILAIVLAVVAYYMSHRKKKK